jgi:hypothetical protein
MAKRETLREEIGKAINPYNSEIVHYSRHDVGVLVDLLLSLLKVDEGKLAEIMYETMNTGNSPNLDVIFRHDEKLMKFLAKELAHAITQHIENENTIRE